MSFMWDRKTGKIEAPKVTVHPRSAIVLNLRDLEQLIRDYIAAVPTPEGTSELTRSLLFSGFLAWAAKRERELGIVKEHNGEA
jgi:hypothetical protein